jgi:lipoate-protein ligase B
MRFEYLAQVDFARALERQEELHRAAAQNSAYDTVLGFEPSKPVVTLGKRAERGEEAEGFQYFSLDRGGQATIHNPGQLVIFPVCTVDGVRAWVERLWQVTQKTLRDFGVDSEWDEACPGLYTSKGKIVSLGVRVRSHVSTHGIAINVANRLEDFSKIQACGVRNAKMDRMGEDFRPRDVYLRWCENFEGMPAGELTSRPITRNLVSHLTSVRS